MLEYFTTIKQFLTFLKLKISKFKIFFQLFADPIKLLLK